MFALDIDTAMSTFVLVDRVVVVRHYGAAMRIQGASAAQVLAAVPKAHGHDIVVHRANGRCARQP